MPVVTTLRRSRGSIILSIPKSIAQMLEIEVGSVVELTVEGKTLSVTPARRGLAARLSCSPKSPDRWQRDEDFLHDEPAGRELL
jgi:antitoxin component of MazEF toxin-antitoxin module